MTGQAPVHAFNRKEANVQDGEGFAVIWRRQKPSATWRDTIASKATAWKWRPPFS
jgi:hypothetical protein